MCDCVLKRREAGLQSDAHKGTRRGSPALATVTEKVVALLGNGYLAAALGVALGAALLFASRRSFRLVGPDSPERGLALAAVAMIARMAAAVVALVLYRRFVPAGVGPFGLALAGTFLALYTVELVRNSGLRTYSRPTRARG